MAPGKRPLSQTGRRRLDCDRPKTCRIPVLVFRCCNQRRADAQYPGQSDAGCLASGDGDPVSPPAATPAVPPAIPLPPPPAAFDFPLLPPLDKHSIPALTALMMAIATYGLRKSVLPDTLLGKALMLIFIFSPIAT